MAHAVALGLLHGPTELLPVSSSAHTTLVPWLAGWPYLGLESELRKSFEVALHAGTVAALLISPPRVDGASQLPNRRCAKPQTLRARLSFLLAAVIPPALVGYTLGGQIERRLGTPATLAAGLLAGSGAMILGDSRGRAHRTGERPGGALPTPDVGASDPLRHDPGARDGIALGIAQASALMPGVSRSGATLACARARGFSRLDSDRLSWQVGLPVIAGAALLKGIRLVRATSSRGELQFPFALGAASAFLSTLASAKALTPERRARMFPVCVAYRVGLASLVIRRMRDNTSRTPPLPKK